MLLSKYNTNLVGRLFIAKLILHAIVILMFKRCRMILLSFLLGCFHHNFDARMTAGQVAVKELVLVCDPSDPTTCKAMGASAAGTATRVIWDNNYYWLTAAHVCNLSNGMGTSIARVVSVSQGAGEGPVEISRVTYNIEKDLCIMPAKSGPAREIAKQDPALGDHVSIIAYPGGAFNSNILPIYDGRFTGHSGKDCLTTIPVAGGSSGAGVLDDEGNVIGVVSAVMRSFNHYTITVCLSDLRSFLSQAALQEKAAAARDVQTEAR